jgi:hypothetical protein
VPNWKALFSLHWWSIQGDVHPGDGRDLVNGMDVLITGLVLLGVDSAVAVPIGVCCGDFNYDAMPNEIVEHNVRLRIPECAFNLR